MVGTLCFICRAVEARRPIAAASAALQVSGGMRNRRCAVAPSAYFLYATGSERPWRCARRDICAAAALVSLRERFKIYATITRTFLL